MKGYQVGDQQRQAQKKRSALLNAQQIYAQGGDATPELRKEGMFDEASQYEQLAEGRKKQQLTQSLGAKLNAGDLPGAQSEAYGAGDIDLGSKIGEMSANLSAEQRAKASQTMSWLGQNVVNLKNVPPQNRLQAATDLLKQAGLSEDPKVMTALQQAAADGKITDEEIDRFRMSALSIAEQFKVEQGARRIDVMRERNKRPEPAADPLEDDQNPDAFPDDVVH